MDWFFSRLPSLRSRLLAIWAAMALLMTALVLGMHFLPGWAGGLVLFGLPLALALGLALALATTRRVFFALGSEPRALREFVVAIGDGDLRSRLELTPGDRTSVAANATRMQAALRGLVGTLTVNAQALRGAASEISAGNMDLSGRTEQTAAAMARAAAGLDEVLERVRQRSGNLSGARGMVGNTRQVAEGAGEQMRQMIATMRGINESARRIVDIIGTIDGIAFQTNILALNAAVEAARAGEQGRGFAVVAGEVRSLARRSADAAREIKDLIGASVERTEAGARQVDGTGRTLEAVVADIQKLAELVAQIDAEATQDSAAMAAVLQSLQQVDQAVQQNAALVEQMAASSQSLDGQAERLAGAVAGFRA